MSYCIPNIKQLLSAEKDYISLKNHYFKKLLELNTCMYLFSDKLKLISLIEWNTWWMISRCTHVFPRSVRMTTPPHPRNCSVLDDSLTVVFSTKHASVMFWFTLCHISKSLMFTPFQTSLISSAVKVRGPVRSSGVHLALIVGVGKPHGEPQFSAGHPSIYISPAIITNPALDAQVCQVDLACVGGIRRQRNGVPCQQKLKLETLKPMMVVSIPGHT